ncbi:MAG: PepSY domain-containing protein [Bacilli bacterium]|nr:PepSY domain-containing protein [Bacilli bacterium]
MRKREIEKQLNQTISNSVPDVLDNILAKCEKKKGFESKVSIMEKEVKQKNKFSIPKLATAFAALVIVGICGVFGFNRYDSLYKVDSIIEFDVNPSVELEVNKAEEVISVVPLNKDGEKILEDMDFNRVDLDVAVNAIIGSMLKNGYITVDENSILVSVKNDDTNKATKLKEEITKEVQEILSANSIDGSILSQTYSDDEEVKKLAEENDLSEGKAKLINEILASDIKDHSGNAYTFESLSKLSINELNLLLTSKKAEVKDVNTSGTASENSYIGREKAKEIALNNTGVSSANVRDLEIELDADDGRLVYEVEFKSGSNEYEYEIHAKTGDIIHKQTEKDDDRNSTNSTSTTSSANNSSETSYIGKDKAKEIAFNNAGVSSSDVRELEVELDEEDGRFVYEIGFKSGNTEYEYEVHAKTGDIIHKQVEKDYD